MPKPRLFWTDSKIILSNQNRPVARAGFFEDMSYKYPYIFVFGAGRSGSTILQSLLNADPSVLIRGENNNFFYTTFCSYRALLEQRNQGGTQRSNPWFGYQHFKADEYLKSTQKIAHTFLMGEESISSTKVLGFKEVRLFGLFNSQGQYRRQHPLPHNELEDYIRYLTILFPRSRFIFLERNPAEIASSGWWKNRNKFNPDTLINDLTSFHKSCKIVSESVGGIHLNHSIIRSKNITEIERRLYKPLDLPFNKSICLEALSVELKHCKK